MTNAFLIFRLYCKLKCRVRSKLDYAALRVVSSFDRSDHGCLRRLIAGGKHQNCSYALNGYFSIKNNRMFLKCPYKIEYSHITDVSGVLEQGPKIKCIKRSSKHFGDD